MLDAYPEEFELVFGGARIARLWSRGVEFPGFWGRYELLPGVRSDPALREILEFHDHCVRVIPVDGAARLSILDDDWERYERLVNSHAWALVRANGERLPILVPLFDAGRTVVWRLA